MPDPGQEREALSNEGMREYGSFVKQIVRGVKGQMLKTGHCNICGAVLAISVDGKPFRTDDPELVRHAQYHEVMLAAIKEAKLDV